MSFAVDMHADATFLLPGQGATCFILVKWYPVRRMSMMCKELRKSKTKTGSGKFQDLVDWKSSSGKEWISRYYWLLR